MIYVIKRDLEMPFDGAFSSVVVNSEVYDVVKSPKNSGLELIAEVVVDGEVIIKSNPRTQSLFETALESINIKITQLLFS